MSSRMTFVAVDTAPLKGELALGDGLNADEPVALALYEIVGRRQSERRIADIFGNVDCAKPFDHKAERSRAAKSCGTTKA